MHQILEAALDLLILFTYSQLKIPLYLLLLVRREI
jgi:hypothetical protein